MTDPRQTARAIDALRRGWPIRIGALALLPIETADAVRLAAFDAGGIASVLLSAGRAATLKLAEVPRNSSATRIRNRCEVTGRPRAFYRKLKMSRIALRELGSKGLVPGLVKSSW